MEEAFRILNTIPLAGLMLVVALGYLLGRLEWRGLSLGPAGGTMGIAILFGFFGLSFHQLYSGSDPRITVGGFGFALFIYAVGFEAGPRFFSSFRGGTGWHFPFIGILVNVLALALAMVCGWLFGLGAADSSEPTVSYAASYAVASVLATLAGQVVVLLM